MVSAMLNRLQLLYDASAVRAMISLAYEESLSLKVSALRHWKKQLYGSFRAPAYRMTWRRTDCPGRTMSPTLYYGVMGIG